MATATTRKRPPSVCETVGCWGVMNNARIVYTSHPDATPKAELNALVAVYAYLLNKKAAECAPTSNEGNSGQKESTRR
jgi:hypothetical protein